MNLRPSVPRLGLPVRRIRRAPLVAALFAYSVLVFGSAILHHDFACHQTSRTHCTACTWAQLASGIESDDPTGTWQLPPAGELPASVQGAPETLLSPRTPGRSPPLA
jgi:hypothetical protein